MGSFSNKTYMYKRKLYKRKTRNFEEVEELSVLEKIYRKITLTEDEWNEYNKTMWQEVERIVNKSVPHRVGDNYNILLRYDSSFLLAKLISLAVVNRNNNNVFQPYEMTADKELCVISVIDWSLDKDMIEEAKRLGDKYSCPYYRCVGPDVIKSYMDRF